MSSWTCAICGRAHERLPTGFEADPPCRVLRVTEADSHAALGVEWGYRLRRAEVGQGGHLPPRVFDMLTLLLTLAACGTDTDTDTDTDSGGCVVTTETCNCVDDDCDGAVDEAGSAGESRFYVDGDGDGYGDGGTLVAACTAPDGCIVDGADCDVANDAVRPGQAEVVNDGADNDCAPSSVVSMNLYDAFSATANPFGNGSLGYAESADGAGFVSYTGYGEYDASVNDWESARGEGARVYRNHTESDRSYASVTFATNALALHPGETLDSTVGMNGSYYHHSTGLEGTLACE